MASDQGIAPRIESLALEVMFLVLGVFYTFWHFLFRPRLFRQVLETSSPDAGNAKPSRQPYARPASYAALCIIVFFLYLPAIVGFRSENYPVLGTALDERIGFLNAFTTTVKFARLPQIIMMLIPLILAIGLHAAIINLLLKKFGFKTEFLTELGIDCYALGTGALLICVFVSRPLINIPLEVFSIDQDSLTANILFAGVLTLLLAAFAVVIWRYLTLVYLSCCTSRDRWHLVAAAVIIGTAAAAMLIVILVVFWLPFLLQGA